jgi:hypothetical protein
MPEVVKSQVANARAFLQPLPCETQTLADIGKRSLTLPSSDPSAAIAEGLRGMMINGRCAQIAVVPRGRCGSEETRSRQLAAGRPCIPRGSQVRADEVRAQKNLQFDEMLLDSRHALVFTHGSFTTIRIAFSQGFWGRPTNVAREKSRAYSGAIT